MASGCGEEDGQAEGASWRLIGPVAALSSGRCRLLFSSLGRGSDVCLFYVKGEFFAMDARCAHSGKTSTLSLIQPRFLFTTKPVNNCEFIYVAVIRSAKSRIIC